MLRLALLTSLSLLSVSEVSHATSAPAVDTARMDATFQRLGKALIEAGKTDALSIAVVDHGKVRFYHFGSLSPGRQTLPTERTVYEIGSITKVFTSLLLAHAIVDGKAKADDDLRTYLPGPYANLAYRGTPVRLVDLADTTSGLPDNLPDSNALLAGVSADRVPFVLTKALTGYDRTRMLEDLRTAQLSSRPGQVPKHSNLASLLLAGAVEKAYGRPFAGLLDRYIETPFGMDKGLGNGRAADFATGYDAANHAMPALDAPYIAAAGGLRYSARDMSRFVLAELNAKDPAIALSQRIAWGNDSDGIAYNWKVTRTIDGERRLHASGGTLGFSSYMDIYPDTQLGIVLLANRPGETQNQLQMLADQAIVGLRGKPAAQVALESALAKSDFRDFPRTVASVRRDHPELYLAEGTVNDWAYGLLKSGKAEQAIGMFQYNADRWPKSPNAWDSLAEGYEATGDKDKATGYYRRSLELNPDNEHARQRLAALAPSKR